MSSFWRSQNLSICRERGLFGHDAEDFFLAHDQKLFAIQLDLGTGILTEQDRVASLYIEREDLAFVVRLAFSNGNNGALLRFFLGRIGDNDPPTHGFAPFMARDQDAVMQRCKLCCCHNLLLLVSSNRLIIDLEQPDRFSSQVPRLLTIVLAISTVNCQQVKCE